MSHSGGNPGPDRWSWTRLPAAAPFRSKLCAWARTPLQATSIPCPCCSTRSFSNTSPNTASASPMKSANGASGLRAKPRRNWPSSIRKDADGATPIAYLWARTIQCEGPGCGCGSAAHPLALARQESNRSVALQLVPNPKANRVDFQIIVKRRDGWVDQANPKTKIETPKFDGTVKRGSATCPCCGYTTPVARVREQLKARRGGANDARLMCVVSTRTGEQGRFYRLPTETDLRAIRAANCRTGAKEEHPQWTGKSGSRRTTRRARHRHTWAMIYGLTYGSDLFTRRQSFANERSHDC